MDDAFCRRFNTVLDPPAAVTFFSAETVTAAKEAGLRGYMMGYVGMRAAPLGAAGPSLVEAVFHSFHRSRVERAVPDAWSHAAPADLVRIRSVAGAATLRRMHPGVGDLARRIVPDLTRAVAAAEGGGRPLFSANRDVALPEDEVERLWQLLTALREHRGDGHIAVLTAEGLSAPEANYLAGLLGRYELGWLKESRGYPDELWAEASESLRSRGFVDADGGLTDRGREFREGLEARTDALAASAYRVLADPEALYTAMRPLADAVWASGELPLPRGA